MKQKCYQSLEKILKHQPIRFYVHFAKNTVLFSKEIGDMANDEGVFYGFT